MVNVTHHGNGHRSIDRQASEIDKVKRSESGMIVDPVTVRPQSRIAEALEIMKKYKISGVPVTRDGKLVGIPPTAICALNRASTFPSNR